MKHLYFWFLFVALLLVSCKSKYENKDKQIFHYNESSGILSLDPIYSSGQSAIWACNQIFSGLVDMNERLEIVPAIAKRWEISNDGCTYTFYLRDDVKFHETGFYKFEQPRYVTAKDFVYSLSRVLDKETASPGAWIFRKVKKDKDGKPFFKALNDTVLQIQLSEPFPPFLGILAMKYCSVVPQEVVEHFGKDFRKFPVGTGPFQMQLWEEGVKLVLRKNPNYYETDSNGIKLPYIDAVSISFIVDKQSVFMEFMKGTLDFMSGIDPSYKDALLTKDGGLNPEYSDKIQLITGPYLNTEYLGFNLKDNSKNNPISDKRIRKAINYGFDRRKMIKYLRNDMCYVGSGGFVPMGLPSFNPERTGGYEYDPQKALGLLAEAGYPNGEGLPEIVLTMSAQYADLCQYIQYELSKIGIPIKLDIEQAAQQRQMMRSYQLQFFRGSWISDYPDAENQMALFYSKNLQPEGSNYTHYVNPTFDKLYEKSQHCTNDSIRNDYYIKMDSILVEDAPFVVLYYDKVVRFAQKNVHDLGINPINILDLRRVKISK